MFSVEDQPQMHKQFLLQVLTTTHKDDTLLKLSRLSRPFAHVIFLNADSKAATEGPHGGGTYFPQNAPHERKIETII